MATPHSLNHQPLTGLSPQQRRAIYAKSGMHSSNPQLRTDADAFELRSDVTVDDACVTALRLGCQAIALMELVGMHAEYSEVHRDLLEGVAALFKLANGSVGFVHAALCSEPASEQPLHEHVGPRPDGLA